MKTLEYLGQKFINQTIELDYMRKNKIETNTKEMSVIAVYDQLQCAILIHIPKEEQESALVLIADMLRAVVERNK